MQHCKACANKTANLSEVVHSFIVLIFFHRSDCFKHLIPNTNLHFINSSGSKLAGSKRHSIFEIKGCTTCGNCANKIVNFYLKFIPSFWQFSDQFDCFKHLIPNTNLHFINSSCFKTGRFKKVFHLQMTSWRWWLGNGTKFFKISGCTT